MAYDPLTYRFPRTTHGLWPCDAAESVAIHKYKTPLAKRFFYALCSYGWPWMLTWAIAAVVFLAGCDDLGAHAAVQADLADAIHQAAKGGIHE